MNEVESNNIYKDIADLLHKAREKVKSAVNTTMVHTYFEIGRIIVADEVIILLLEKVRSVLTFSN